MTHTINITKPDAEYIQIINIANAEKKRKEKKMKTEGAVIMTNNDANKLFNKSEILPFVFLNDLVNQKVVVKTNAGDYTGTLKGWDEDLNVVLADFAEIKEMELIRTHKVTLIRGGDINHIIPV